MNLKFRLCEASSFERGAKSSEKLKLLIDKEFIMEEIKNIGEKGDTFTMEFKKGSIKDKALEVYKDKSGGVHKMRLCIVGKKGVYIAEFLEEIDSKLEGQMTMKDYVKNLKK